jgi:hypothetical protein
MNRTVKSQNTRTNIQHLTETETADLIRPLRRVDAPRIPLSPALAPFLRQPGRERALKYGLRQWQGEYLTLLEYIKAGVRRLSAAN